MYYDPLFPEPKVKIWLNNAADNVMNSITYTVYYANGHTSDVVNYKVKTPPNSHLTFGGKVGSGGLGMIVDEFHFFERKLNSRERETLYRGIRLQFVYRYFLFLLQKLYVLYIFILIICFSWKKIKCLIL